MSNGTKNLSRTSTILRSEAVKESLGEQIMDKLLPKYKEEKFTGQVLVEVHVKEGRVMDSYQSITIRNKVKDG
jgi:hypothetical protein